MNSPSSVATVCLETLETGEILFFGLNVSWNIFFYLINRTALKVFLLKPAPSFT